MPVQIICQVAPYVAVFIQSIIYVIIIALYTINRNKQNTVFHLKHVHSIHIL